MSALLQPPPPPPPSPPSTASPARCFFLSQQLDRALDLSPENAQALYDHGAASVTATDEITNRKKISMSASVVSIALHTDLEDTDWTVDGVKSLVWPTGNDPEARDGEGMTMLLLAAKHGWDHMVGTLLAAGASMEATDERGYTPACWVSTSAGRNGGPGEGLRRSLAQRNHGIFLTTSG